MKCFIFRQEDRNAGLERRLNGINLRRRNKIRQSLKIVQIKHESFIGFTNAALLSGRGPGGNMIDCPPLFWLFNSLLETFCSESEAF